MKPFDDEGKELDATFYISDAQNSRFYLTIESRGGAQGSPKPRNPDYAAGIELLLTRLAKLNAVLERVEVFSAVTKNWASDNRAISAPSVLLPCRIRDISDVRKFRLELGEAGKKIGQTKNANGGSSTKKLRFLLLLDEVHSKSAQEIELILANNNLSSGASVESSLPTLVNETSLEPTDNPFEFQRRVNAAKNNMRKPNGDLIDAPVGTDEVKTAETHVTRHVRDPKVVAWVLAKAGGSCEMCVVPAPFVSSNDDPFLEVHHVRPLAEGGPDKTENAVALCPNCHRRLHYAKDRVTARTTLISKIDRLIDYPEKVASPHA